MSLFLGERSAASTTGEQQADKLFEARRQFAAASEAIEVVSNEELVRAFLRVVGHASAVGQTALAQIANSGRKTREVRHAQVSIEGASALIWDEMTLRTAEQDIRPPLEDQAMVRAQDMYPHVFDDPGLRAESGLEIFPQHPPDGVVVPLFRRAA